MSDHHSADVGRLSENLAAWRHDFSIADLPAARPVLLERLDLIVAGLRVLAGTPVPPGPAETFDRMRSLNERWQEFTRQWGVAYSQAARAAARARLDGADIQAGYRRHWGDLAPFAWEQRVSELEFLESGAWAEDGEEATAASGEDEAIPDEFEQRRNDLRAIDLRYGVGLPLQEIAALLARSIGTVQALLAGFESRVARIVGSRAIEAELADHETGWRTRLVLGRVAGEFEESRPPAWRVGPFPTIGLWRAGDAGRPEVFVAILAGRLPGDPTTGRRPTQHNLSRIAESADSPVIWGLILSNGPTVRFAAHRRLLEAAKASGVQPTSTWAVEAAPVVGDESLLAALHQQIPRE